MASDKIKKRKKHPKLGKISKIITYANQHNLRGASHFKLLWQIIRRTQERGRGSHRKWEYLKVIRCYTFRNNSHQLNTFSRLVPNTTEKSFLAII